MGKGGLEHQLSELVLSGEILILYITVLCFHSAN